MMAQSLVIQSSDCLLGLVDQLAFQNPIFV